MRHRSAWIVSRSWRRLVSCLSISLRMYVASIISAIFPAWKLVALLARRLIYDCVRTECARKWLNHRVSSSQSDSIAIVGKSDPRAAARLPANDSAVPRENNRDNRTKSYRDREWRSVTAFVSQRNHRNHRLISFLFSFTVTVDGSPRRKAWNPEIHVKQKNVYTFICSFFQNRVSLD